jgi:hypothetical protein
MITVFLLAMSLFPFTLASSNRVVQGVLLLGVNDGAFLSRIIIVLIFNNDVHSHSITILLLVLACEEFVAEE